MGTATNEFDNRVPISSTYGRRPALILSQLLNLGSAIWRAKATSYNSFMGASAYVFSQRLFASKEKSHSDLLVA